MIFPDWPAPPTVRSLQTTRQGGFSAAPYGSFNLGSHVGDDPRAVEKNRQALNAWLPGEPIWLEQVHGTGVIQAEAAASQSVADACFSRNKNIVCVVMTADCLPILLCDDAGTVVAAVHAGWRGLLDGVIEATVSAMAVPGKNLMAWLGPAIGPLAFEVGAEVRARFIAHDPSVQSAFIAREDKFLADLYLLARHRLATIGVSHLFGGEFCTYTERERFFSYRRDGATGRMASLIWLD